MLIWFLTRTWHTLHHFHARLSCSSTRRTDLRSFAGFDASEDLDAGEADAAAVVRLHRDSLAAFANGLLLLRRGTLLQHAHFDRTPIDIRGLRS